MVRCTCGQCGREFAMPETLQVGDLTRCDRCATFFRHRPLPAWAKLSLAAALALVVMSLAWNVRFFRAYGELKRFSRYWEQGDIVAAAREITLAAFDVPESATVGADATFVQALNLMRRDRPAEALAKFMQCRGALPESVDIDSLILQAKSAAAFKARNYDGFLLAAAALHQRQPTDASVEVQLASALACKYAQTCDTKFRERALHCLRQAQALPGKSADFAEYESRILQRIESREILSPEEFHRRFPQGWSPQQRKEETL